MPLFWLVLFPVIAALSGYLHSHRLSRRIVMWLQAVSVYMAVSLFHTVQTTGPVVHDLGGYPLGVGISLYADRLSSVMVLLCTFLFSVMLFFNYHKPYMNKLFLFLFLILQGLLNGIFLTRDLFNLYAVIEVSTVVVSILIMFKKDNRSMYDGMIYLMSNLIAMAVFLLGVGYIYKLFGTEDLSAIEALLPTVADKTDLYLPYALIITAVALKSAVMPLFSWLPKAHGTPSAPSIVSAILSGLYVKLGVYLFIRFQNIFMPYVDTSGIFLVLGFLTAVLGFIFALSQTDIKLILAYHTVSQIGLIIFGLSMGSESAQWGAIYHVINHAVFKSTLFLTAGIIIEKYGTRDIREIRGVARSLPFVSVIMVMAVLGITGAPLFNGAFSKYMMQKEMPLNLGYAMLLINIGTVLSFVKYAHMLFGVPKAPLHEGHEVTLNQKAALAILGSICFFGGILGPWFIDFLFDVHARISIESYLEKGAAYMLSLMFGFVFYRLAYPRIAFFHKMREFELGLNGIAMSIFVFFASLLSLIYILPV